MSNTKISALTSATTPLAGTEVLPIVQSGTTVKVATDDLTVRNIRSNATTGILQITGPAAASTRVATVPNANWTAARTDAAQSFTGDQTLATGNIIQGTAAKGFNFTANTPASGMTSQLLNWYEEGSWTPVLTFNGNSVGITYSTQRGRYARVGRTVTVNFEISLSSKGSSTGEAWITGLPFSAAYLNSMSVYLYSGFSSVYKVGIAYISNNVIYEIAANGTSYFTDAQFTNTSRFWATCTYQV